MYVGIMHVCTGSDIKDMVHGHFLPIKNFLPWTYCMYHGWDERSKLWQPSMSLVLWRFMATPNIFLNAQELCNHSYSELELHSLTVSLQSVDPSYNLSTSDATVWRIQLGLDGVRDSRMCMHWWSNDSSKLFWSFKCGNFLRTSWCIYVHVSVRKWCMCGQCVMRWWWWWWW